MSTTHKPFQFSRVFAEDGTVLRDETIKRILTREEADAHAAEAAATARHEVESETSRAAAEALSALAGRMQAVIARMDEESAAMRADAARLACAAARVIAGEALKQYGADTIEACALEALHDLRAEPRLAVRVAPELVENIADRLQHEAERLGFEGAVIVRGDEEVVSGDVVLEWRAGAIERSAAEIEARIAETVEKWLARPSEDAESPDISAQTTAGAA
ncbi:MAG: FliH/SctL family protein [Pseudomonadota bacterium]